MYFLCGALRSAKKTGVCSYDERGLRYAHSLSKDECRAKKSKFNYCSYYCFMERAIRRGACLFQFDFFA